MSERKVFAQAGEGKVVPVPGGSTRRVILELPELMMVEFVFEEGGVGALHSHPHIQTSYVAEGTFEVTIDGVTETIPAGGAYIVPSGKVHGVKALTAGRLIDSFTPRREEFL
jgi:quercetin dioxygenase-like cupin family protein